MLPMLTMFSQCTQWVFGPLSPVWGKRSAVSLDVPIWVIGLLIADPQDSRSSPGGILRSRVSDVRHRTLNPVIALFSEPSFHPHLFLSLTHALFIFLHSGIMSTTLQFAMTHHDYSRPLMTSNDLYPFIVILNLLFIHSHSLQGKRLTRMDWSRLLVIY